MSEFNDTMYSFYCFLLVVLISVSILFLQKRYYSRSALFSS